MDSWPAPWACSPCVTSPFLLFTPGSDPSGFQSILSVIVSPLFSLLSTPKPIFIGQGKTGPTPRLQHPSRKIHPPHIRRRSLDKPPSHTSHTLSSDGTTHSIYSNRTTGNESRRTPSPDGTSRNDTHYTSEPPASSPSQPRTPRNDLRTYLGMRKRPTLLGEPTPEEPSSTATNSELGLDNDSYEQQLDQADIIVSPPTPSSSAFLHSAPGPSEVRFGDISTPGKPAARFVKSHSKRHSLSTACTRKSSLYGHPIIFCGNSDEHGRQADGGRANGLQIHPLPNLHHLQQHPWSSQNGPPPRAHHNGKSENLYESTHLTGTPHLRCLLKTEMTWVLK